ncbi:MAG: hypothetical protein KTR22_08025 [Flavobacteriaceae bacterium]|nr:hypothetical protein [Flavobacteriaceae bacterium]
MIKAASLAYAIFISLVIGILCSAMLLVFSLNLSLNDYYGTRSELIDANTSAVAYLRSGTLTQVPPNGKTIQLFEGTASKTEFKVTPWGFFQKWELKSFHKRDTISRHFLAGHKSSPSEPTLFVRNDDGELKIAGKTLIKGDIEIPSGRIKKVTINSKSSLFDARHQGGVKASHKRIPKLNPLHFEPSPNYRYYLQGDLEGKEHINPFHKPTWVIEWDARLEDIRLKGNIILVSKDTLYVHKSSELEDIIIKAPKVIFEKGFTGSLQVMATTHITLEENTTLKYPSVLAVTAADDELERSIVLEKKSTVNGGVILQGNGLISEDRNRMEINKDADVRGTVYCDGKLSLYGKVEGTVYCSALFHKTASTTYDNLLLDATIVGHETDEAYFSLGLGENYDEPPLIVKKV